MLRNGAGTQDCRLQHNKRLNLLARQTWLSVSAFKGNQFWRCAQQIPCPYAGVSQADVTPRTVGGMPYNMPLAMLQMDADPGSLTGFSDQPWSQGPQADTKMPLAISSLQVRA